MICYHSKVSSTLGYFKMEVREQKNFKNYSTTQAHKLQNVTLKAILKVLSFFLKTMKCIVTCFTD